MTCMMLLHQHEVVQVVQAPQQLCVGFLLLALEALLCIHLQLQAGGSAAQLCRSPAGTEKKQTMTCGHQMRSCHLLQEMYHTIALPAGLCIATCNVQKWVSTDMVCLLTPQHSYAGLIPSPCA
jgi:hypothetical protein